MIRPAFDQWRDMLSRPVHASTLATFRVLFGLILGLDILIYLPPSVIYERYVVPSFFFSFPLFDALGLPPLSAKGFFLLIKIMGVAACTVGLGIFTRASLLVLFLTYGYLFLIEIAYYVNHAYLFLLLMFLLFFTGSHRYCSLDALRVPKLRSRTVPFWNILILRAQIVIVYFFAGITKLDPDWLSGRHARIILSSNIYGPTLGQYINTDWLVPLISYGAMAFDLLIGFMLCYKPTRKLAYGLCLVFHLSIKLILDIHMFPFMMLATCVLFMDPDAPKRYFDKILGIFRRQADVRRESALDGSAGKKVSGPVLAFLILYLVVQIALPLRHWLYPGNVNWTHEGRMFSWRMFSTMIISRSQFNVTDPEMGRTVALSDFRDLNGRQKANLGARPGAVIRYAHHLRDQFRRGGIKNPEVRADVQVSLNNRPFYPLIDPGVDLAAADYPLFSHADWIMPHPDVQELKSKNQL